MGCADAIPSSSMLYRNYLSFIEITGKLKIHPSSSSVSLAGDRHLDEKFQLDLGMDFI